MQKKRDKERLKKQKGVKEVKEKRKLPRTTKDTIPYEKLDKYNITKLDIGLYSKTYKFNDVNYKIAKQEDRENIFVQYADILNYFDTTMDIQITIINEKIDEEKFINKILSLNKDDSLNQYRNEYNQIIKNKLKDGNNEIMQSKYFTVTIHENSVTNAKNRFEAIEAQVASAFEKIGSKILIIKNTDKVEIFKNIFREKEIITPNFTEQELENQIDKNFVSPDYFEFKRDYFMFGDKYARSVFLRDIGTFLKDEYISELTNLPINQILSINISPIETTKALKIIDDQISAMKMNKGEAQKKLFKAGYSTDMTSHKLEQSIKEAEQLHHDCTTNNQKMFLVNLVTTIVANDYEELELQTKILKSTSRKYACNLSSLNFQQEEGMTSCLPIGKNILKTKRTLTTESTAVLMPFNTKDFIEEDGRYYGMNPISNNIILLNRKILKNLNGFILGVSGSGKSFTAKREMLDVILNTDDDVIVVDPENEYGGLLSAMGGEVINISAVSKNHINPLDMSINYVDEGDPITFKVDFILSLCESLIGTKHGLGGKAKSIIDRCLKNVYKEYVKDYDEAKTPTLKDFYNELLEQEELLAQEIALELEIYIEGSLSVFSNKTNVDIKNRLTCFNTKDLGKNLTTMGILIVLDCIWNRVSMNKKQGKNTWLYYR